VLVWRLAVRLRTAGLPRLAKLLWRLHVMLSACHLHLDATAGPGLKLPHPTGVTLGVGVRLGPRVTVYQHVTIGAGFRDRSYPVIGEGAILFPGAVVVGGITVGARAVVGANAVVLADVPADAVVAGNPARIIRSTAPQAGAALPQDL
jgi:serine O-acetyltransferase